MRAEKCDWAFSATGVTPRQGQRAVINRRAGGRAPSGGCVASVTTYAYVGNQGSNLVSICPVLSTGKLGTCTTSDGSGTFASPIAPTVAGGYLYVSNGNSVTVSVCPITGPNGALGTCAPSITNGRAYYTAIADGYAYVTKGPTDSISICPVVANGALGTCSTSNADGMLDTPYGIARAANGYAYIANYFGSVAVCLDSGNSLTSCSIPPGFDTFGRLSGVAVVGNYMYVANINSDTVDTCLLASPDVLQSCTTRTGFSQPSGIAIFGGKAYVTNLLSNTVSICPLLSGGAELGSCSTFADTFSKPTGIAFVTS